MSIFVEAAQVADMELDYECILERSTVATTALARMPFIGLKGRYNKRWFVDIITLPHNAIRRQLTDLFQTLTAAGKMVLDLTEHDVQLLFRYLASLVEFFKVVLDGEEEALYPYVHEDSALRRLASMQKEKEDIRVLNVDYRKPLKEELFKHLDDSLKHRYTHAPSVDLLRAIVRSMDKFGNGVLAYFAEKEKTLPKLLSKHQRSKDKNKFEGRLISNFLEKPNGHVYVVLLMQTLFNPEVRDDFLKRHFARQEQREAFDTSLTEAKATVLMIPQTFESAGRKYEKKFSVEAFMKVYGTQPDDAVLKLS